MRMRVVALSPSDFETWVANQLEPAAEPTDEAAAARARRPFIAASAPAATWSTGSTDDDGEPVASPTPTPRSCAGAAPNLTHLMSRTTFAGAIFDL